MLSLLFIIQIKMYVNNTNQEKLKELSHEKPVFALFYSHHCGHCKKVYPTWTEMMTFYENDTDIITAESDCVNHPKTCNFFMKISGYPTFAYIINGVATEVMLTRTLDKFKEFVESLKKIDPKVPCQMWFSITEITEYPIFVYSSPQIFSEACQEATHFINENNKKKIFIDSQYDAIHSNSTRPQDIAAIKRTIQLAVQYDRYRKSVIYDEGLTNFSNVDRYNYISDIIDEYSRIPLSDFDEKIFGHFSRNLIILLYMGKHQINQFKELAYANSKDFLFMKMNISDFKKKYPDVSIELTDAPALFISDKQKNNFMILKNQDSQGIVKNETLKKIIDGEFAKQMILSLKDIKIDIKNNTNISENSSNSSAFTQIFMILGMILIIGVLFTIIFALFERFCRTRKIKKRNYYLDKAYKGGCHKILQLFGCSEKDVLL